MSIPEKRAQAPSSETTPSKKMKMAIQIPELVKSAPDSHSASTSNTLPNQPRLRAPISGEPTKANPNKASDPRTRPNFLSSIPIGAYVKPNGEYPSPWSAQSPVAPVAPVGQVMSPVVSSISSRDVTQSPRPHADGIVVDLERLLRIARRIETLNSKIKQHAQSADRRKAELEKLKKDTSSAIAQTAISKTQKGFDQEQEMIKKLGAEKDFEEAKLKSMSEQHYQEFSRLIDKQELAAANITKLVKDFEEKKITMDSSKSQLDRLKERVDKDYAETQKRLRDSGDRTDIHNEKVKDELDVLFQRTQTKQGESLPRVMERISARILDVKDDHSKFRADYKEFRHEFDKLRKSDRIIADLKDMIGRVSTQQNLLESLSETVKNVVNRYQYKEEEMNLGMIVEELHILRMENQDLRDAKTQSDQPGQTAELMTRIKAEIIPSIKAEIIPTIKAELTPNIKAELTPKIKAELIPEIKAELKAELLQAIKAEVKQEIESDLRKTIEAEMHANLKPRLSADMDAKIAESTKVIGEIVLPKAWENMRHQLPGEINSHLAKKKDQPIVWSQLKAQLPAAIDSHLAKKKDKPVVWSQLKAQLPAEIDNHLAKNKSQPVAENLDVALAKYATKEDLEQSMKVVEEQGLEDIKRLREEWSEALEAAGSDQDTRVNELDKEVTEYFKKHLLYIEELQAVVNGLMELKMEARMPHVEDGLRGTSALLNSVSHQQAMQKIALTDLAFQFNNLRATSAKASTESPNGTRPTSSGRPVLPPNQVLPSQVSPPTPMKSTNGVSSSPPKLKYEDLVKGFEERFDKYEATQRKLGDRVEKVDSDYELVQRDLEAQSRDLTAIESTCNEKIGKVSADIKGLEEKVAKLRTDDIDSINKELTELRKTGEQQQRTPNTPSAAAGLLKRSPSFGDFSVKAHRPFRKGRESSPICID